MKENSENENKLLRMIQATANDLYEKTEEITGIDDRTTRVTITITCDAEALPKIKCNKVSVNMATYEAQQGTQLIGGSL